MTTFDTGTHSPCYRTRLMTEEAARRFGKCLTANPRFAFVKVCHSARATGEEQWFVMFQPSAEHRQEALLRGQQDARAERAAQESFTVLQDPGRAFWWVYSERSGATYQTTTTSCDCRDHQYRTGPAGLKCKHSVRIAAEEESARTQRQEQARRFETIFGERTP